MSANMRMFAREIGEMPMRTRHCNWETRLQIRPLSCSCDGKAETRYTGNREYYLRKAQEPGDRPLG